MEAKYLARGERSFPTRLLTVKPPVKGIWYRGSWDKEIWRKTVAIVGSRKMTQYGRRVLEELVPRLVAAGYTTISGFMYGIDIEMHRLTVESGGRTIGVFGWGIDWDFDIEFRNLYNRILESRGLFISEMKPNDLPTLWSFPQRNRLVVSLAERVIVVEAGLKSGSLNSAGWARKLGKELYAVPGSIFSPVSAGCNYLIENGFAKPLTISAIKQNYSEKERMNGVKALSGGVESSLVALLRLEGPKSTNEIARVERKSAGEVGAVLTQLNLKGVVALERGEWKVV